MTRDKTGTSLANNRKISAKDWEELSAPKTYEDAVALAARVLAARLDARPTATWRLRIDRHEDGQRSLFIETTDEGQTRVDLLKRILAGERVSSQADRAMVAQMIREIQATAIVQGKGRPSRERDDLNTPIGQSMDAIFHQTCGILTALGWRPLARAGEDHHQISTFDVVADAMTLLVKTDGMALVTQRPATYHSVKNAYYRYINRNRNL